MKPDSYPFLKIAKKYNVDYTEVLQYADWLQYGTRPADVGFSNLPDDVIIEVRKAFLIQDAIRNGEIDWITGRKL